MSRGIDFNGVSFVINFDLPVTAAAYTHRVGRTARGGANGTALSFITAPGGAKGKDTEAAERDGQLLREIQTQQPSLPSSDGDGSIFGAKGAEDSSAGRLQPSPLLFNMRELESFRYRVEDTLRSVTGIAVRELRAAEIKREIINSAKLRTFFANNPNDLRALRHEKAILHPIRQKDHLKHVPEYLIPASMRSVVNIKGKRKKRSGAGRAQGQGGSQEQRIKRSRMNDPLLNPEAGEAGEAEPGEMQTTGAGADKDDTGVSDSVPDKVFTEAELAGRRGASGRTMWKMKHKKGKFNPKVKKPTNRVAGSFIKGKKRFN